MVPSAAPEVDHAEDWHVFEGKACVVCHPYPAEALAAALKLRAVRGGPHAGRRLVLDEKPVGALYQAKVETSRGRIGINDAWTVDLFGESPFNGGRYFVEAMSAACVSLGADL